MAEVKTATFSSNGKGVTLTAKLTETGNNPGSGTYGTKTYTFTLTAYNGTSTGDKRYLGGFCEVRSYNLSVSINVSDKAIAAGSTITLGTKTVTINAEDAKGTFLALSMRGDFTVINAKRTSGGNSTLSYSFTPAQLDRKSSISSITSPVSAGGSCTVSISRKHSSITHTLSYKGPSDSSFRSIASGVTTSRAFSPVADCMKSAKSGTVTVRCVAAQGGTTINTVDKTFTFNVPSSYAPSTTAPVISDAGMFSSTQSYLQKFGKMLTGLSIPKATWTETVKNGATISSRSIVLNGKTLKPTAANQVTGNVVSAAGTVSAASLTVTDSRGYASSAQASTSNPVAIAYEKPSLAGTQIYRSLSSSPGTVNDNDGDAIAAKITTTKTSIPSSSNAEQNFVTVRVYLDGALKQTLTETASAPISSSAFKIGDANIQDGYTVRMEITDTVGQKSVYETYVPPAVRVLSFKEDGTGVAFGKIADQEGFECEWDAQFNGALNLNLNTAAGSGDDYELIQALSALGWWNGSELT